MKYPPTPSLLHSLRLTPQPAYVVPKQGPALLTRTSIFYTGEATGRPHLSQERSVVGTRTHELATMLENISMFGNRTRHCTNRHANFLTNKSKDMKYPPTPAYADEAEDFFNDPAVQENYNNPNIPQAPEEKSGLVVLRVAEVAQFQEKILRSIVSGELEGVKVAPMQFTFGTQILLRNSNLDGNIKLMLDTEIPRRSRKAAVQNAVAAMNQLQEILQYSNSIQRDFEPIEMATLADMYRNVRVNLNQLYEYLPDREKEKYYGYFVAVTEYEKKIADGTYNPDLDGILKFDD